MLAVSCASCRNIKFFDLEAGKVSTSSLPFHEFCAWPGPQNGILVTYKDGNIMVLNSSVQLTNTFNSGLGSCGAMCFLPAPYNALVVRHKYQIKALSTQDGKERWGKKYRKFLPGSLLFIPEHNVLLVSVEKKPLSQAVNPSNLPNTSQIQFLDPAYGTNLHSIKVPNIVSILSMSLNKNEIMIFAKSESDASKTVLCRYTLTSKSEGAAY